MKLNQRLAAGILILTLCVHFNSGGGLIAPSGPVHTVIAHEASDDDKAMGQLLIGLRGDSFQEYFSSGGRRLSILDDDGKDETGKQVIQPQDLEGVTLPAQLFYVNKKLVAKEPLPKGSTPETVVANSRRFGG